MAYGVGSGIDNDLQARAASQGYDEEFYKQKANTAYDDLAQTQPCEELLPGLWQRWS